MNSTLLTARTERFDEDTVLLIDLMRGIAALMVLFTHAFDLSVVDAFGWNIEKNPPIWHFARASIGNGSCWVWCFFVISGMCIHQSIARSIESGSFRWRSYALARATRIYPLFLIGLVLAVVAFELHEDWAEIGPPKPWPQFISSLFSLQIFTSTFPSFGTSWSLSCEALYYAAWPMLLLFFKGKSTRAAYVASAFSFLTLVVIFVAWQYSKRLSTSTAVDGLWTVMTLFPIWVAGAWLGAHWREVGARVTLRLWHTSFLLCVLSELLFIVLKYRLYPSWTLHMLAWTAAPGLLIFFAGAHHLGLSQRPAWKPFCAWLGNLSYPSYILHMQLLLIVHHFTLQWLPKSITGQPFVYLFFLLVPVLGALLVVGPWLESRIMSWRAGFLARRLAR